MSEQEQGFQFPEFNEDNLDISAIFGGSGSSPNPFAAPAAPQPVAAPVAPPQQEAPPVVKQPEPAPAPAPKAAPAPHNPIEAAFSAQEDAGAAQTAQSLFEKLPVFTYSGATERIEDSSMTFEELRISKSDDFPELAEGKKVTWAVEYGKVTKSITNPEGTTIASVKSEIERSKPFLDGLKKAKDQNPDCLVKPKVTAQSKGIATYKGVFPTMEEARASDKVICLIPARDGQVYELRKTELGEFIAPKSNVLEFGAIRAGFTPALPLIPKALMEQIITFFRSFMNEDGTFEALAHIYWDREVEEFTVHIPTQEVSKAYISADLRTETLPEGRYLHYADIHSHNDMEAKFSHVDDADERATRLYLVVGRLDRFYPTITARASCGGVYQNIDPAAVLESMDQIFPNEWLCNVTRLDELPPRQQFRGFRLSSDSVSEGLPEAMEE